MRALIAAVFSALLSTLAGQAAAAVIIDFEDQALGNIIASNLQIGDFRFSPNCHYDLLPPSMGPQWNHPSQWIGLDANLCGDPARRNPNYLGTTALGPSLWVDYSETPFTLLGLDAVAGRGLWSLTSSNGGNFMSSSAGGHVDFSGSQWADITWLLFTDRFAGGIPQGFDNISFSVADVRTLPEPSTLVLVGGALAFLTYVRRKRPFQ